ncbi:MAG: (d)CMP kinase [Candidatus Omnitrophica bacterium]|nr:(d)CMP kinase [Candidatus Omnitrophota bacterium]
MVIAIDGPAGSGKSTVAKLVAEGLGYLYVDTGAMYRALTWKALKEKVDLKDENALTSLSRQTEILLKEGMGKLKVFVDGEEVTESIREGSVTENSFYLARVPSFRAEMVKQQRKMARGNNLVMEGRDIGTVVFPKAELKVYLDASLKERARRRFLELKEKGINTDLEVIEKQLQARDKKDKSRKVAPLKIAEDAFVIDSTKMKIEKEVDLILRKWRENYGAAKSST